MRRVNKKYDTVSCNFCYSCYFAVRSSVCSRDNMHQTAQESVSKKQCGEDKLTCNGSDDAHLFPR